MFAYIHIPEECQGPEHPIQPGVILHSLIKCDFFVEVEVFVMLNATRPFGERSVTPIRGWNLEGIFLGPGNFTNTQQLFVSPLVVLS